MPPLTPWPGHPPVRDALRTSVPVQVLLQAIGRDVRLTMWIIVGLQLMLVAVLMTL